jgi:hypothetical protein
MVINLVSGDLLVMPTDYKNCYCGLIRPSPLPQVFGGLNDDRGRNFRTFDPLGKFLTHSFKYEELGVANQDIVES